MHQALTTPPLVHDAKKRRQGRRRKIIFGSAGAVVLLVIALVLAGKREKPIPVTTEKAARRTILQTVSATGKIQPETEVKISPEVAGEITELPVEDGMQVKKGDLLVKIKPDSYKALLEQQEAAISAAKATNLQQKATMLKTEHDLRRSKDLFDKKLISEQEYNAAEAANDVAKYIREFIARNRTSTGELKSGARSAFKNHDLFADGRNSHHSKQQTGRTPCRDQSICRDRCDASRRSHPHASRGGRERK
jgi:multidrug efflux pump subunit AcrA (membrane-fusion protein)